LHPLPAHLRRLTDTSYLALSAAIFVTAALVQLGLYFRLLRPSLQTRDVALVRAGMVRWIKIDLVIQVAILAAAGAYIAVQTSNHVRGAGVVGPPVGAVLGSALPLQVVVAAMLRAVRGA
jgi:hypothetical protein